MITQIIDNGNTLRLINEDKLDSTSTEIYDLEKTSGIKIKYLEKPNYINIWDEARRMFFTIKHEEVTFPYSSNTLDLYNTLIGMLNTGISVGIKDSLGRPVNLDTRSTESLLSELIEEQRITNKYLRKIYNPE